MACLYTILGAARVAMFGLAILGTCPAAATEDPLAAVERTIAAGFTVDEVSARELDSVLTSADSSSCLLFDVREAAEFGRSHIRDAHLVAPAMAAEAFMAKFGEQIEGKRLVFYCSVGYRSSVMAARVRDRSLASGARSVANLRGGIFRWYNEGRAVHDSVDTTDAIHPYDRIWGVLVHPRQGAASSAAVDSSGR